MKTNINKAVSYQVRVPFNQNGVSKRVIKNFKSKKEALRWKLKMKNLGGKRLSNKNRALSIEEYNTLNSYLSENTDDELNVLLKVILNTGLRKSEAFGLRTEHVCPNHIKVKEAVSRSRHGYSTRKLRTCRTIAIDKTVYELIASISVKKNGYIFNHKFLYSNQLSNKLKELLDKLNVKKTTVHGLRKTQQSITK